MLPQLFIPAHNSVLLRFKLPWLARANLSTPPTALKSPAGSTFCFEYPLGAFEAELSPAINPKILVADSPA
jgi:hypothetical protein